MKFLNILINQKSNSTLAMESQTETALILIVIGSFFFIFGGLMLLDRLVMIAGNIIFSIGVLSLLLPQLDLHNRESMRNLSFFVVGISLMICGFAFFGFLFQFFAVISTIKNQLPSLKGILLRNYKKLLQVLRIFG